MAIHDIFIFGAIAALAIGLTSLVELRRDRLSPPAGPEITGSINPGAQQPGGQIPWVAPLLLGDENLRPAYPGKILPEPLTRQSPGGLARHPII
jgi:hypothetical protein